MKSEILTRLLEERLKSKIDLLESRNRVQNEEISHCEKLVDEINKLIKLSNNNSSIEEKPTDHETTEQTIKTSQLQSSHKDHKSQINLKTNHKAFESKPTEKSIKLNTKIISQENINNNKKQTRNASAQKNFSTNTKVKKNDEETSKNLNSKKGKFLLKRVQPKTPKNDKENNIKPFNKYNSQKNLGTKLDTNKINKNSDSKAAGDLTPVKKNEKSMRKLNSCVKIDKEKSIVKEERAKQTSLLVSSSENQNKLILENKLKEVSMNQNTIEKGNTNPDKIITITEKHNSLSDSLVFETKPSGQISDKVIDMKAMIMDNIFKISVFLNKKDIAKLSGINQTFLKKSRESINKTLENELINLKEKIKNLNEKYTSNDLNKEIPPFLIPRGTVKAVELLNDSIYIKLFTQETTPSTEILFAYRIFFQFLQHPLIMSKTDNEFWEQSCKFFLTEPSGKTGDLINNVIKNFVFTEENIYKVYKICEGREKKINPSVYSKICGTTGLIIFVIRDALEYTGIIIDKRTLPARLNKLYTFCLDKANENFNKLNSFDK